MEEDVFLCGWKELPDGIEVWVKNRPHIRAKGKDIDASSEALVNEIANVLGVYFAPMEFVPPLPRSEFDEKYSSPDLYTVCGNDTCEIDEPRGTWFESEEERALRKRWYHQFFVTPCCADCGSAGGPRNESRLTLTHVRGSYDGGLLMLAGAWIRIFSERFIELLTTEERERLEFRPVERPKRSRKRFFELIGPPGPPRVALASLPLRGWRCGTCGFQCFGHDPSPDRWIHQFIARSDLPAPLPQIFTIGTQPSVELCITAARWATMVEQPGTRGLLSQPLGVAPDEEIIRQPELEIRNDRR